MHSTPIATILEWIGLTKPMLYRRVRGYVFWMQCAYICPAELWTWCLQTLAIYHRRNYENKKTCFIRRPEGFFLVNPTCDFPILSADELFNYHHTLLKGFVRDKIIFVCAHHDPAFNTRSHARTNYSEIYAHPRL